VSIPIIGASAVFCDTVKNPTNSQYVNQLHLMYNILLLSTDAFANKLVVDRHSRDRMVTLNVESLESAESSPTQFSNFGSKVIIFR